MNSSKQLVLYIAAPIGTTGNVLYGELPYDALSKELNHIKIGESGYAFVINHEGMTVIHPELANVEKPIDYLKLSQTDASYLPIANIYRQMVAGKTGTGFSVYKGVRRLVAYTPLSGPEGWSAAVTTPVNQLDENLYRTLEICVGVGLLLALIAILITRIFARKITEPIVRATRRIESLAEGDLHEEDEPIKGKDEGARLILALQNTVHSPAFLYHGHFIRAGHGGREISNRRKHGYLFRRFRFCSERPRKDRPIPKRNSERNRPVYRAGTHRLRAGCSRWTEPCLKLFRTGFHYRAPDQLPRPDFRPDS